MRALQLEKHDEGCSPLVLCQTCKVVNFLQRCLSEPQFKTLIGMLEQPDSAPAIPQPSEEVLGTKIEDLELSVRSANICRLENITTVRQLIRLTEAQWLNLPNAGRKQLNEVKAVLAQMNLEFARTP